MKLLYVRVYYAGETAEQELLTRLQTYSITIIPNYAFVFFISAPWVALFTMLLTIPSTPDR